MNRFRKKFKNNNCGPKNDPLTPFCAKNEFSLKSKNYQFYPPFNVYYQVQFQKNLMKRFTAKVQRCWCWLQKWSIYSILGNTRVFQIKRAPPLFGVFWTLTSCKIWEKSHRTGESNQEMETRNLFNESAIYLRIQTRIVNILIFPDFFLIIT